MKSRFMAIVPPSKTVELYLIPVYARIEASRFTVYVQYWA